MESNDPEYKKLLDSNKDLTFDQYKMTLKGKSVNGKFIIYNINHLGSLIPIISLRLSRYRENGAILILPSRNKKYSEKIAENLNKAGIFDEIKYSDIFVGTKEKTQKAVKTAINDHFNALLFDIDREKLLFAITENDVVDSFSLYCLFNKFRVIILENSLNSFNDSNKYEVLFDQGLIEKSYYYLQKNNHTLCGEDGSVPRIRFSEDFVDDENYYCFRRSHELLHPEDRKIILQCFGIDNKQFEGCQILLCNSGGFVASGLMQGDPTITVRESGMKYNEIYQTFLDHYGDKFIHTKIKLHPYSGMIKIESFKNASLIDGFPIEIINLMDDLHLYKVIGVQTTSSISTGRVCSHQIQTGVQFYNYYPYINQLFVAIRFLKLLKAHNVLHNFSSSSFLSTMGSTGIVYSNSKVDAKYGLWFKHLPEGLLQEINIVIGERPNLTSYPDYKLSEIPISCVSNKDLTVLSTDYLYLIVSHNVDLDLKQLKYLENLPNRDVTVCTENYRPIISQVNPDNYLKIARSYRDCDYSQRDYNISLYFIERYILEGHDECLLEWAILCFANSNSHMDEAERIFMDYSKKGNNLGSAYLCLMYYYGKGVKKDMKEAKKYYGLALQQGNKWIETKIKIDDFE